MKAPGVQRLHRVTTFALLLAGVFGVFFQVNKAGPFRDINPFAQDPYDAIGSFGVQAALVVGVLSFARAVRIRNDPSPSRKIRLVLRGDALVLAAVGIPLIADATAVLTHPLPRSLWGDMLVVQLVALSLLAILVAAALAVAIPTIPSSPPPRDLTPADALDDLWALVRVPLNRARRILPGRVVDGVGRLTSDSLFSRSPWIDPRRHPWRFACLCGFAAGLALVAAQLQEGLPPSLGIGLLVAGIYISGELLATVAGFAILGGYLGIRPSLGLHK